MHFFVRYYPKGERGMEQENCLVKEIGYERFESVIDLIGGKWKLRIIFILASNEVLRYGELKKLIQPITHKMLTIQLKELTQDGLVIRTEYPQVPPKVEYKLSQKGRDLQPIVMKLCEWMVAYGM